MAKKAKKAAKKKEPTARGGKPLVTKKYLLAIPTEPEPTLKRPGLSGE